MLTDTTFNCINVLVNDKINIKGIVHPQIKIYWKFNPQALLISNESS